MKNYIANERGDWVTSSAYIRYSLGRSIHYGRKYTSGGRNGDESDLCEALRCLGKGLHTLEDFGAHTNYCELALREMGFRNVFPHTGTATQINLHGHHVFPLVTGTFGMVDFLHSVLGEATDHFTQSEINEMDIALGDAQSSTPSSNSLNALTGLLGKVPGTRDLVTEAEDLRRESDNQESANRSRGAHSGYTDTEGFQSGPEFTRASESQFSGDQSSGMADFDPQQTIAKIYPILRFRDNVLRKLTSIIEKIPGLEALVDKISETLTIFIMSLLAPFIRPIINMASRSLHTGASGVIDASGKHQYEPWTDPTCTDPTHSLLSKDHFSNILNEPAGHVASAILRYVAPRVLYAWDHPSVSEQEVVDDCLQVFHHPALRNMHNEAHRTMFEAVQSWVNARPDRGANIDHILSAEGVKAGKNNNGQNDHSHGGHGHSHGGPPGHHFAALGGGHAPYPQRPPSGGGSSMPWDQLSKLPIPGISNLQKLSDIIPSGLSRDMENDDENPDENPRPQQYHQPQPHHHTPPHHTPSPGVSGGSAGDYYSQSQHSSEEYNHYAAPHQYSQGGYQQGGYPPQHQYPPQHWQQPQQPYQQYQYPPNYPPGQSYGQGYGHGYGQGGYGY